MTPTTPTDAATRATYLAFIGAGFTFASWVSRIPQFRDRLELSPAELGLLLLGVSVGSLVALPLSGAVIARLGSRRTVAVMSLILCGGVAVAATGYRLGVAVVFLGLLVVGLANGAWDVAMNVQGARVEHQSGRTLMSRFHAGWSVGTVAGALVGAAAVAAEVDVTVHLLVVAVVVAVTVPPATRAFLEDEEAGHAEERRSHWAAWREPRTLLIGVFVLAFAFTEGVANDWLSVALIDDHGTSPAVGTLGFAAFVTAMTLGRWFGPAALDRYGRVPVVQATGALALVGVLLFVFGSTELAFVGVVLWGVGASLGFPVGMSAGADEPAHAASRVSVISSIGYCAFLAGPPLIGLVGERVTVLRALLSVAVLLGVAALVASNLRPLENSSARRATSRSDEASTPVEPAGG